jgi:hypothetical protein
VLIKGQCVQAPHDIASVQVVHTINPSITPAAVTPSLINDVAIETHLSVPAPSIPQLNIDVSVISHSGSSSIEGRFGGGP